MTWQVSNPQTKNKKSRPTQAPSAKQVCTGSGRQPHMQPAKQVCTGPTLWSTWSAGSGLLQHAPLLSSVPPALRHNTRHTRRHSNLKLQANSFGPAGTNDSCLAAVVATELHHVQDWCSTYWCLL